jgi:hypothetical protein
LGEDISERLDFFNLFNAKHNKTCIEKQWWTVWLFLNKLISCFFSVLRQFKIVKPTRQQGGKKQTSLKNKSAFARCMDEKHIQNLIYFIYQERKYLNKE